MSKKLSVTFDKARVFTTPEGATVGYVTIDKEMATALLSANKRNRNISDRQVQQYGRALETPNGWAFTGDAIRLGPDGLVLDGQHRLLAIEKTGVSMPCLIVTDLNEEVRRYIDSGRKRSSADELTMEGIANGSLLTSISRAVMSWKHWRTEKASVILGNSEVTSYTLNNVGVVTEGGKAAMEVRRFIKKVSGSAVGAAYVRACEVSGDPFVVASFFTRLATGENMTLGDPLHSLRNTLIRAESANQVVQLWQIVRAWNAGQDGEGLKSIVLPKGGVSVTKFPDMIMKSQMNLTELDEQAAEAMQKLTEEQAVHAA